jgi:hypothetical protein
LANCDCTPIFNSEKDKEGFTNGYIPKGPFSLITMKTSINQTARLQGRFSEGYSDNGQNSSIEKGPFPVTGN